MTGQLVFYVQLFMQTVEIGKIAFVFTGNIVAVAFFFGSKQGQVSGIMITASHNPKEYNGMKFVRQEAKPISGDTGLRELET